MDPRESELHPPTQPRGREARTGTWGGGRGVVELESVVGWLVVGYEVEVVGSGVNVV